MLADTNSRPTLDEQYEGAASSSNLRVWNDEAIRTPADLIVAAGMNKHRMGLALLRLHSEWSSSAKPLPPTKDAIATLARTYRVETDGPHRGKVKLTPPRGETVYVRPQVLASSTADAWYRHELGLLMMQLKSLPSVRTAIAARSRSEEWGADEHVIAAVLLWWMNPKCTTCGGRKGDVVKLRGKEVGKVCTACKGTGLERQGDPPHGPRGKKVAGYISGCLNAARAELREGVYRRARTAAGAEDREDEAARQKRQRDAEVAREEEAASVQRKG